MVYALRGKNKLFIFYFFRICRRVVKAPKAEQKFPKNDNFTIKMGILRSRFKPFLKLSYFLSTGSDAKLQY